MASIDTFAEPETLQEDELGGLDLNTARLDDMSQVLARLEFEKRGLLENIRILRVRLADEKVNSDTNSLLTIQRCQGFSPRFRAVCALIPCHLKARLHVYRCLVEFIVTFAKYTRAHTTAVIYTSTVAVH